MRQKTLLALACALMCQAALRAKPAPVSDLERVREAAGTRPRFDRLETVVAQADLIFASTAGVVSQPFALEARRVSPRDWSVHERLGPADRHWTAPGLVFRSAAPSEEERARERFFLLLAPDHLARGAEAATPLGLGYFQGRLCRRIEVPPPAGGDPWTVYVDSDTHRLRGVATPRGDAWLLENDELFQNQFALATRWTRYSPEGERMEIVRVTGLAFNVFLTDFKSAAAEPPAALDLGDQR
jgi:hypothetical protein